MISPLKPFDYTLPSKYSNKVPTESTFTFRISPRFNPQRTFYAFFFPEIKTISTKNIAFTHVIKNDTFFHSGNTIEQKTGNSQLTKIQHKPKMTEDNEFVWILRAELQHYKFTSPVCLFYVSHVSRLLNASLNVFRIPLKPNVIFPRKLFDYAFPPLKSK